MTEYGGMVVSHATSMKLLSMKEDTHTKGLGASLSTDQALDGRLLFPHFPLEYYVLHHKMGSFLNSCQGPGNCRYVFTEDIKKAYRHPYNASKIYNITETPPSVSEGAHVLHSVTCLKTCHFAACFTSLFTSIFVFYVNTTRDVVTALLTFAKYLSLYLHIFTCTYRGTRTQAHLYNQHTRGMATTWHRSLVERDGRKALLETLHTHQKNVKKHRYSRI